MIPNQSPRPIEPTADGTSSNFEEIRSVDNLENEPPAPLSNKRSSTQRHVTGECL